MLKSTLIGLIFTLGMLAQTTPTPSNLATVVSGAVILGIHPTTGAFVTIKLDPSIVVTTSGTGEVTLSVATPAVAQTKVVRGSVKISNTPSNTVTLPSLPKNGVDIYVSGFALTEVEDYTRVGAVITFVPKWAPKTGAVIRWVYEE